VHSKAAQVSSQQETRLTSRESTLTALKPAGQAKVAQVGKQQLSLLTFPEDY
jgi:hypothetical protein